MQKFLAANKNFGAFETSLHKLFCHPLFDICPEIKVLVCKKKGMINLDIDQINQIFVESVKSVVYTVSGVSLVELDKKIPEEHDGIVGIMPLSGSKNSMIMLEAPKGLDIITSYMIGIDVAEITEKDLIDCIGELANMVSGTAKLRLVPHALHLMLSTPFVAKGAGLKFFFKRSTVFEASLGCEDILLNMRVLLF